MHPGIGSCDAEGVTIPALDENCYMTQPVHLERLHTVVMYRMLLADPRETPARNNEDNTLRVLLIEDDPVDAGTIRETLRLMGDALEVVHSGDLAAGLSALAAGGVDVVILDPGLPGSQGAETCTRLRDAAPDVPIVILTADEDGGMAIAGLRGGAQDYLVKGRIDADLLSRSLRYAIEVKNAEVRLRHAEERYRRLLEGLNGGIRWTDAGVPGIAGRMGTAREPDHRLRELHTLYSISRLIGSDGSSVEEIVRGTAELLPGGFAHPDRVAARIVAGSILASSSPDAAFSSPIVAGITVDGRREGYIEVGYRDPHAPPGGRVFLDGERELVNVVAEMLGRAIRRIRAEDRVRLSEAKYRELVENANSIILRFDRHGRITFFNEFAERFFGYPAGEIAGKHLFETIVPETETLGRNLQQMIDDIIAHPERYVDNENENVCSDGRLVWVRWTNRAIYDDSGDIQDILAVGTDITERRRAEEELKSRNHQLVVLNEIIGASASSLSLAELLETALVKTLELMDFDTGAIYMLDADRRRATLQYHRGLPDEFLFLNRTIAVHHWPQNIVFVAGKPRYVEQPQNRLPGSLEEGFLDEFCVSSLACIPLIAESVVVGALYVGSRRKAAFTGVDRELLEAIGRGIGAGILRGMLHRRLEAAHREANLYLDILSHDIKNAENVSSLYTDLLLDLLDGEAEQYAHKLRGSIAKSINILDKVSTIRRIHQETADLGPIDLDAVIREEIAACSDAEIAYDGFPVTVRADSLLSEVFANLLGNSLKLGGPGVGISVTVEEYDGEDETVLVSVEDTGPGVPDEMKRSIFHRFERGSTRSTGDGLGLYIVRMLVERYGGRIWVDDRIDGRPDLGAAFRFTLKRQPERGGGDIEPEEEA
ncbi:sensory transduction histidine kinase [hydrocarbon metagenome]|uniref:histidine kinase n=1 Tax=hydrocarbon metagenome TaxID=938273 RepID=A0A0W8FF48_9ZZZZ|nr:PAS domain S-box protein [Methanomicrobiaceae archaeon]